MSPSIGEGRNDHRFARAASFVARSSLGSGNSETAAFLADPGRGCQIWGFQLRRAAADTRGEVQFPAPRGDSSPGESPKPWMQWEAPEAAGLDDGAGPNRLDSRRPIRPHERLHPRRQLTIEPRHERPCFRWKRGNRSQAYGRFRRRSSRSSFRRRSLIRSISLSSRL
jgi:hypothetical protein